MRKITLPNLKDFLSITLITGGFTLIAAGFGRIFGFGVGMVTAGILLVILQWWLNSD